MALNKGSDYAEHTYSEANSHKKSVSRSYLWQRSYVTDIGVK